LSAAPPSRQPDIIDKFGAGIQPIRNALESMSEVTTALKAYPADEYHHLTDDEQKAVEIQRDEYLVHVMKIKKQEALIRMAFKRFSRHRERLWQEQNDREDEQTRLQRAREDADRDSRRYAQTQKENERNSPQKKSQK
jgi:hypothetical protein